MSRWGISATGANPAADVSIIEVESYSDTSPSYFGITITIFRPTGPGKGV
jgi:hypothetical protein